MDMAMAGPGAGEDPLAIAARWRAAGEEVAVATVLATWGSSPCPAGSRLVLTRDGRMAGSVSGGCIEGEVALAAIEALDTGRPGKLVFDVATERAWAVGLACGGRVDILVAPLVSTEAIDGLLERQRARRPVSLATRLEDGRALLLDGMGAAPAAALEDAAEAAMASGLPRLASVEGAEWFVEPHPPAARLIVVGAVHVAQFLAPMAVALGFSVTVVDPRRHFLTEARFPGVDRVDGWPDEAMAGLGLDAATSIVALTHDPKLDDPALDAALGSAAAYIGALGSKRSHASRLERLASLGHDAATLARIRGPVGLAIGAIGPAEIALSIMAEVVAARRGAALGRRPD